jgi:hypothetical protein
MPQAQQLSTIKTYPIELPTRIADIETALMSDETVAVVENPDGDQTIAGGRLVLTALSNPSAPTVTPTGGAAGSQSYVVVANLGTVKTAASAAGSTGSGPTTLDATHFNTLVWAAVAGATSYDVYRTAGGAAQGKIASGLAVLTLVDDGLTGDTTTAPSINGTGTLSGALQDNLQIASGDGAITAFGRVLITKVTAAALTLAVPVAGAPSAGGQDGSVLSVTDTTGHAHTVTTPANGIVGSKHIATFGGTANNTLVLVAYNGIWYVVALGGSTIS